MTDPTPTEHTASDVVVITGRLGWGNRGYNSHSSLDAYGPGDRWARPGNVPPQAAERSIPLGGLNGEGGDVLADALADAGAREGHRLVIVAVPSFSEINTEELAERLRGEL